VLISLLISVDQTMGLFLLAKQFIYFECSEAFADCGRIRATLADEADDELADRNEEPEVDDPELD
jgi:hypothetical protein